MTRLIFGALIAVILLFLYCYAVFISIMTAACIGQPPCATFTAANVTDGVIQAMTLIGGLVSALVIAQLAISKPGVPQGARLLGIDIPETNQKIVQALTLLYLIVWVVFGLAAFVFGVMLYPKVVQSLTDAGSAWLGLAVAAAYSYFGIQNP